MAYRGDLAAGLLADALTGGVGLLFLGALFSRIPDIAGWSLGEVLVVWGTAECAVGLATSLFAGAAAFNRQYLVQGGLDGLLLRPLNPWLQVLLDHAGPQGLVSGLLGVGMVALGFAQLDGGVPARAALLPLFACGGAALLGALLTASCAVGFWLSHRGSMVGMVQQGAAFGRYPAEVFAPGLRRLLTFGFPALLLSALPVAWVLGRAVPLWLSLGQPLLGAAALVAATAAWHRGLRRYGSTGT